MTHAVRNLVSFRSDQARLVAYVSVAHGLVHTIELTYAALLSRIEAEFGGGFLALGAIANVFAFTFGASALPAGFLVDRLGSRRVLVGAFVAAAALSVLVALSPNPWWLAVSLGLLGLAIGLYHPAGIALIAQGAEQRSLAFGYHGVSGNIGIALAPVLAVGVAVVFGWRAAYVVTASLALVVVATLRYLSLPEGAGEAPAREPAGERRDPSPAPLAALLVVYAAFVLNGFVYRGSLTFIPTHLEDRLGVGDAWVGALTTAALLAGAFGQLAGGALAERHTLERLVPLQALALAPGLLLIGALSGFVLVPVVGAFVFAYFAGQPIFTSLIADYSPSDALGRSYGFTFFAAFGLGSGAATFAGFFADRWGTDAVFFALAGVAAVTFALALRIWRYGEERARAGAIPRQAIAVD